MYIMANRSRGVYVGVTSDLRSRVWEHKTKARRGFTTKYAMTKLVYFERWDNMLEAIKREKQLKGWRRSKKTALIESINPNWLDLSQTNAERKTSS